ncbi:hypothetical protein E2C01_054225 [Portunus trituberculatus]|uniref:Uncharacterized protein n=1 Tax=Portunus trituberculatus TaxID=210409 RepID=A0A5B7GSM3_PORTR|nr:hypothetical protein [Portunus trituberculatus]
MRATTREPKTSRIKSRKTSTVEKPEPTTIYYPVMATAITSAITTIRYKHHYHHHHDQPYSHIISSTISIPAPFTDHRCNILLPLPYSK